MPEIEPTSGFLKPSDFVVNSNFTEFESIPSRGYCLLTRAKRNGRWWMLKGLKEPYLKLIDFGLSDTDSHAILKAPAGTEGYMAPDGPSDI